MMRVLVFCCCIICLLSCNQETKTINPQNVASQKCYQLLALDKKKAAPNPEDWIATHHELPQSFKDYVLSKPLQDTSASKVLTFTTLGPIETDLLEKVRLYTSSYFNIKVVLGDSIPFSIIPSSVIRINNGASQILSPYLIDSVLPKYKNKHALLCVGFTSYDLYPAENWNFVFGQANLYQGLGVWSTARLKADPKLYLGRLCKLATHEIGHMFGLRHCTKYECNMNGSNSLAESDAQPFHLCWECLAKLCYNRKIQPEDHLSAMYTYFTTIDANSDAANYYRRALELVQK